MLVVISTTSSQYCYFVIVRFWQSFINLIIEGLATLISTLRKLTPSSSYFSPPKRRERRRGFDDGVMLKRTSLPQSLFEPSQ
jgi:hypothetical protein